MIICLRSLLFNISFYVFSVLFSILALPFLVFPRPVILFIARIYAHLVYALERTLIDLRYEVRGMENLPKEGSYLVAAKHQSAYETLKLYRLFDDPSIILKHGLLYIPIWGWFLARLDIIGINRKNRESAMTSIIEGALRMKEQGRPIIIFPQGTRVKTHITADKKPYKGGIIKMYNATDLPIIPMALNSGLFWGKNSFIKKPGTVVFEFLPAIEPGLPDKKVMQAIEERLETNSIRLMDEAKEKNPSLK